MTAKLLSEARVQRAVHVSAASAQSSAPLRVVSAFHMVGALRLAGGYCCTMLTTCLEWVATKTLRQNGSCPELSKRRCSSRKSGCCWCARGWRGCCASPPAALSCFEVRRSHRQPFWTAGAERTAVCALDEEMSCNIRTAAVARIPLAVPLLHA